MQSIKAIWQNLFGDEPTLPEESLHVHDYEMTFPNDGLDWVFVCNCGDTQTDINKTYGQN